MADFARIMDPDLREHYVYRHYDAAGRLLYVGCSLRPEARFKDHKASRAPWTTLVAKSKLVGPYTYKVARDIEREAIRTEDPLYNGQSPRNLAARIASRRLFDRVLETALANGATRDEAGRLALIAVDSETEVMP